MKKITRLSGHSIYYLKHYVLRIKKRIQKHQLIFFYFLENYCFKISDNIKHVLIFSTYINILNITL